MFRIAFLTQLVLFARSLEYIYSPLARISNVRVVTPALESLEDSEELLIMSIVVQLGRGQSARVERDRSYLII